MTSAAARSFAATDQPLQLVERSPRHEHLLIGTEHLVIGKVADREPVRVSGHHAQATVLSRQQHSGEDRPGFVGTGGANNLAQGLADSGRGQRHR